MEVFADTSNSPPLTVKFPPIVNVVLELTKELINLPPDWTKLPVIDFVEFKRMYPEPVEIILSSFVISVNWSIAQLLVWAGMLISTIPKVWFKPVGADDIIALLLIRNIELAFQVIVGTEPPDPPIECS